MNEDAGRRTDRQGPDRAVRLTGVTRTYGRGRGGVTALDDVTAELAYGSFTAVMGPSGSGKSTFLHCASGLDRPDRGTVEIGGRELGGLDETALTRLRREQIGFVFQAFNLLPALTAEQNITVPVRLAGRRMALDPAVAGTADRPHRPGRTPAPPPR